MERYTIHCEPRSETGKGHARSLRRSGYIPAVLYRAGRSTPIKVRREEMVKFINSTMGEQVMISLRFADGGEKLALLKDYQVDPVKGQLLHTDFYEVSLKEKVRVTISIVLKGEPEGVKKEGGVLQQVLTELEVECLPDRIPPHIEIDVSGLKAGESIHVSDIQVPEGVRITEDPEEVVATVTTPTEEAVTEEVVEEEMAEPEVVKKGKKEEAPPEEG